MRAESQSSIKRRWRQLVVTFVLVPALIGCASEAAEPTATDTPAPPPTDTPAPTDTQTPTEAPTHTPLPPTETPTLTPTPGPIVFQDDFSGQSGDWLDCVDCEWEGGALLMGPYSPTQALGGVYTVCGPCGTPTFFRMAVDATFDDGQTDRGYGLVFQITEDHFLDLEISPLFLTSFGWEYDRQFETWSLSNPNIEQVFSGLVKPGRATNRLEIEVVPSGQSRADVYYKVNGRNAFVLFNRPVEAGQVGLIVGWHSLSVAFDNFEFEEIEP